MKCPSKGCGKKHLARAVGLESQYQLLKIFCLRKSGLLLRERQRKWGFPPTSCQEQGCSVITSTSEHHCSNLPQASLGRGPRILRYFATHLKRWRFNCLGCGTHELEQGRKAKEENKDSWISKVGLLSSFLLLFACLVPQKSHVYSQGCGNTVSFPAQCFPVSTSL